MTLANLQLKVPMVSLFKQARAVCLHVPFSVLRARDRNPDGCVISIRSQEHSLSWPYLACSFISLGLPDPSYHIHIPIPVFILHPLRY